MYTLGIYIYILFVKLAALFGHRKARLMLVGHKETFAKLKEGVQDGVDYLWFHASSLGEFEQGRPLIEAIREKHPKYRIVLTFFSPSGYESAKKYQSADVICYLPFDTKLNAERFVTMLNPKMVFFVKYEFWMNFLYALKHKNIPTYSVSSIFRPKQLFFRFWGGYYRKVLGCFRHFFVQNEESRTLLASIGYENVTITGDTRFDRVVKILEAERQLPLIDAFVQDGRPIFIAGSSWGADEDVYLPYFAEKTNWKLIIASHEVNDARMSELEKKTKKACVRYTTATMDEVRAADCLLIDCFGLLSSIYRYANVAYIGGGFGVGIHNILEAAVYGVPVLFGPNNAKFQEAADLKASGGGIEVHNASEFASVMNRLSSDVEAMDKAGNASRIYVSKSAGATEKILAVLGM